MPWKRSPYGLSPPVRGTAVLVGRGGFEARFIPARAGNREQSQKEWFSNAVYPRPCGEQVIRFGACAGTNGLSPPVRGTGAPDETSMLDTRFIPARAGNSSWSRCSVSVRTVYPRPCGEQMSMLACASFTHGLSPPVRGTGHQRHRRPASRRFIPARAGNSWFGACPCSRSSVYPRPCGEQR